MPPDRISNLSASLDPRNLHQMSSSSAEVIDQRDAYNITTFRFSLGGLGSYQGATSLSHTKNAPQTTQLAAASAIEGSTTGPKDDAPQHNLEDQSKSAGPSQEPLRAKSQDDGSVQTNSKPIQLQMITCIHARPISEGSPAFSLLAFKFSLPHAGTYKDTWVNETVSIRFVAQSEIEGSNINEVKILTAGASAGLSTTINGKVEWAYSCDITQTVNSVNEFIFGVLLQRSPSKVYYGKIDVVVKIKSAVSRSWHPTKWMKSELETICFDTAATPKGVIPGIDVANLEASGKAFLEKLHLLPVDQVEALYTSSAQIEISPDPATKSTASPNKAPTGNRQIPTGPDSASNNSVSVSEKQPLVLQRSPRQGIHFMRETEFLGKRVSKEDNGCKRSQRVFVNDERVYNDPPTWKILISRSVPEEYATAELCDYIVLGIFARDGFLAEEKVVRLEGNHGEEVRRGIRSLRGWKRLLSLRTVVGFSIYECDPEHGNHSRVELDDDGTHTVRELYASFRKGGYELIHWRQWLRDNLNNHQEIPEEGRLSVEVRLGWSVSRLFFVTVIPVALSLAIGFWYQAHHANDPDAVGTAWVISTYIVAAAAVVIALLGITASLSPI